MTHTGSVVQFAHSGFVINVYINENTYKFQSFTMR